MPVGLLEVRGTIDVSQFWPEGRSDADTTKVVVSLAPDAIRFRKNDGAPFQPTHIFEGAKVKGRTATASRHCTTSSAVPARRRSPAGYSPMSMRRTTCSTPMDGWSATSR
jgi:hypothetical protein